MKVPVRGSDGELGGQELVEHLVPLPLAHQLKHIRPTIAIVIMVVAVVVVECPQLITIKIQIVHPLHCPKVSRRSSNLISSFFFIPTCFQTKNCWSEDDQIASSWA